MPRQVTERCAPRTWIVFVADSLERMKKSVGPQAATSAVVSRVRGGHAVEDPVQTVLSPFAGAKWGIIRAPAFYSYLLWQYRHRSRTPTAVQRDLSGSQDRNRVTTETDQVFPSRAATTTTAISRWSADPCWQTNSLPCPSSSRSTVDPQARPPGEKLQRSSCATATGDNAPVSALHTLTRCRRPGARQAGRACRICR
jgi:hypothetical protein